MIEEDKTFPTVSENNKKMVIKNLLYWEGILKFMSEILLRMVTITSR